MAAAELLDPQGPLSWLFVWVFGMTHFVLTFTIYLTAANLRYFAANWRNALVFFAAPVAILVGMDLVHAFKLGARFLLFAGLFWGAIRLFDFYHLNRQTFGVLQMFKGRTRVSFPAGLRKLENAHCVSGVLLLMTTFLAGGVSPLALADGWLTVVAADVPDGPTLAPVGVLQVAWVGLAAANVGLFAAVLAGVARTRRLAGGGPGFGAVAAYLTFQSVGVWAAAAYLPLYLAALAVHYVEYHVLMVPRCFHAPLDPAHRIDRAFGWVRRQPILFYTLLLVLAAVALAGSVAGMGVMGRSPATLAKPFGYLALIAVFDGIFVFHYFVEMFIWRFSDPHFRKSLSGLYFAPPPGRG